MPKDAKNTRRDVVRARINISKATYDEATSRLKVHGWRLVTVGTSSVVLATIQQGVLGEAKVGQERLDVAEKHPEYEDENSGWSFEAIVPGLSRDDRVRAALMHDDGIKPFETDIQFIEASPSDVEDSAKAVRKKKVELLFTKAQFFPERRRIFLQAIMVHGSPIQKVEFLSSVGRTVTDDMIQVSHPEYGTKVKWNVEILCPAVVDKEFFSARIVVDGEEIIVRRELTIEGPEPHRVPTAMFPRTATQRLSGDEYAWFTKFVCSGKPLSFNELDRRVVYYPAFDTPEDLGNHYARAAWYLTGAGSPVETVTFGVANKMEPAPPPDYFCDLPEDLSTLKLEADNRVYAEDLRKARVILIWKAVPDSVLKMMRAKYPTAKILTVCTDDIEAIEYGNYTKVQWTILDNEDRKALLQNSRDMLARKIADIRATGVDTAAVFGTGPSLDQAFEFDFSDCFTVVCNSIINSPELLDHIKPSFICAGDVVSHFGVSTYAAKFREDLVAFLRASDCTFFTTSDFGFLMLSKYPDLREKIIICQQTANGPVVDLLEAFSLPKLDSTLNIHMLPLASTVAKTIYILGCDGKNPDPQQNEDFWGHSQLAQYHDLVETGHLAHPSFDARRQAITHTRFVDSTAGTFNSGEFMGRRYYSLKPSFTPSLKSRPAPFGQLLPMDDGTLKPVAHNADCPSVRADGQSILITARVNPTNFSGGRYHAFLMAEALAESGHQVTLWVDNMPKWYFNLALLPGHPNITLHVNYFSRPPVDKFDWVIVTPDFSDAPDIYVQSLQLAKAQSAKVAMINFESPNWFNELVDQKRPAKRWRHWLTYSNFADVMISSAAVSTGYARQYYGQVNDKLAYVTVPPSINSGAADWVRAKQIKKIDQIVCISRFGKDAAHKNITGLLPLLSEETRGFQLALIVGTGDLPDEEEEAALREQFAEYDVTLRLLHNISDIEKFEVIGQSKLMIFQSLFEGFGYPPIEAQYLDCQCVAYDLPVLREFSDGYVTFVEHGNEEAMRAAIADVLRGHRVTPDALHQNVAELGSVKGFAARLQSALFDNPEIKGGQVRKFRKDMFLSLSKQYEQHSEAIVEIGQVDPPASDADAVGRILAKHFRALADDLARLSGDSSKSLDP